MSDALARLLEAVRIAMDLDAPLKPEAIHALVEMVEVVVKREAKWKAYAPGTTPYALGLEIRNILYELNAIAAKVVDGS